MFLKKTQVFLLVKSLANKVLDPIWIDRTKFDDLEESIFELFQEQVYKPIIQLMRTRDKEFLQNAVTSPLTEALESGRITFNQGIFKGKFNSKISSELIRMGAKWNKKRNGFEILKTKLPDNILQSLNVADIKFNMLAKRIISRLKRVSPKAVADAFKGATLFKGMMDKVDKKMPTVVPNRTQEEEIIILDEYEKTTKLAIKNWTKAETQDLREKIIAMVDGGARQEEVAEMIRRSYRVTASKAKFLARQESNLFLSKYKESRYEQAGIKKYIWTTVQGSPAHPVRPEHAKLNGKTFYFSKPPIVNKKGDRKNPGEDYNCRCVARPVLEF